MSGMLRPSFQRKMPPRAQAERGASFQPNVYQHAADQMDHQIAAHAGAVLLPAAPACKALGIEGDLGCVVQPGIPVEV